MFATFIKSCGSNTRKSNLIYYLQPLLPSSSLINISFSSAQETRFEAKSLCDFLNTIWLSEANGKKCHIIPTKEQVV